MPAIHLIPSQPAALVIVRFRDSAEVLVLVDVDQPWRRIYGLSRPLLPRHERLELVRALLA